jgi:hypothetical protein
MRHVTEIIQELQTDSSSNKLLYNLQKLAEATGSSHREVQQLAYRGVVNHGLRSIEPNLADFTARMLFETTYSHYQTVNAGQFVFDLCENIDKLSPDTLIYLNAAEPSQFRARLSLPQTPDEHDWFKTFLNTYYLSSQKKEETETVQQKLLSDYLDAGLRTLIEKQVNPTIITNIDALLRDTFEGTKNCDFDILKRVASQYSALQTKSTGFEHDILSAGQDHIERYIDFEMPDTSENMFNASLVFLSPNPDAPKSNSQEHFSKARDYLVAASIGNGKLHPILLAAIVENSTLTEQQLSGDLSGTLPPNSVRTREELENLGPRELMKEVGNALVRIIAKQSKSQESSSLIRPEN